MSFDGILWIIIYAFLAIVIIIAILKKCKVIKKKEKTPTRQAIEISVIVFVALLIVGLMVVEWIRQEEFRRNFVTESFFSNQQGKSIDEITESLRDYWEP